MTLLTPELLERVEGLSLIARRVVEGALQGLHKSPMRGLSVEFAQHREYAPGDELKHLDWKVLGRQDRYVIRQYEQETNLRAILVLDASASMAYGPDATTKLQHAKVLAAALAYLLVHQGDAAGLVICNDEIRHQLDARANPAQIVNLCHALESVQPAGRTRLAPTLDRLSAGMRRRSLVILLSDLLDEPAEVLAALGRMHHAGHEPIVLQVLHDREINFDLGDDARGATVIRDIETGAEFEAEPRLIAEKVRAEIKRFFHDLDHGARRHGIHLVRCTTKQPPEEILTRYLHYRASRRRKA